MPDEKGKKKSKNLLQRFTGLIKDLVDWVEETFGDPVVAKLILEDLGTGVKPDATASPQSLDPATRAKIDEFVAKSAKDVDSAALAATAAHIAALVDTGMTFAEAVKADGVEARDVFWLIFKVWVNDYLRVRNPAGHAVVSLATLLIEEDETLGQLDLGPLLDLFSDDWDGEAALDRLSLVIGATLVVLDAKVEAVGGVVDAAYGWDPAPGDDPASVAVAGRTLTVKFNVPDAVGVSVDPILTLVAVPTDPAAAVGPGIVVSGGGQLEVSHTSGATTYTFGLSAGGLFALYLGKGGVELISLPGVTGPGVSPSISVKAEPSEAAKADAAPALIAGAADGSRLEIGSLAFGVEVGADHAAFRTAIRKGQDRRQPRRRRRVPGEPPRRERRDPLRRRRHRGHRAWGAIRGRHRAEGEPAGGLHRRRRLHHPVHRTGTGHRAAHRAQRPRRILGAAGTVLGGRRPDRRRPGSVHTHRGRGRRRRPGLPAAQGDRPATGRRGGQGRRLPVHRPGQGRVRRGAGTDRGGGRVHQGHRAAHHPPARRQRGLVAAAHDLRAVHRPHRVRHLPHRGRRHARPAPSRRHAGPDPGDEDRGARRHHVPRQPGGQCAAHHQPLPDPVPHRVQHPAARADARTVLQPAPDRVGPARPDLRTAQCARRQPAGGPDPGRPDRATPGAVAAEGPRRTRDPETPCGRRRLLQRRLPES